ncbi:MAG TPA: cell division protein FtsZ [Candidatus Goldiibacteriota bacterium]|nr:cell division protein FtsZ [Candidatus Goldiibacteriota bacterium]
MEENKLKFDFAEEVKDQTTGPIIKIMGVGGCGCNIINDMMELSLDGGELVAVNTDMQSLSSRNAHEKLQIGKRLTNGQGAGSKPEVGEKAAEEDRELLENKLRGTDMLFIAAGLGGGTGSGAAPVIADIARGLDILTVAVVITPFKGEMQKSIKKQIVEDSLKKLREKVNNVIVISNDKIREICENLRLSESYREANKVLIGIINGIVTMVGKTGMQNIDFQDVKTTLRQRGDAFIGIGRASGTDRAQKALHKALNNPFIGAKELAGAKNVLINFTGDIYTKELDIIEDIQKLAGDNASVKYGVVEDAGMGEDIEVVVMVSGISGRVEDESCRDVSNTINKMSAMARQLVESGYDNVDTPAFERYPFDKYPN